MQWPAYLEGGGGGEGEGGRTAKTGHVLMHT